MTVYLHISEKCRIILGYERGKGPPFALQKIPNINDDRRNWETHDATDANKKIARLVKSVFDAHAIYAMPES